MAERSPPEDLMLAYVYGELSGAAARAFEERLAQEPELRAEVEGLRATRDLLQADARYGEESGQDEPPPHLLEAILHAEALSRPPEIRRAAAGGERGGLLQKLSLWLVGGGLAVSAAAAVLLVAKSEAPAELDAVAAPTAPLQEEAKPAADLRENAAAPFADAAPASERQTPPPEAAEPEAAEGALESVADAEADLDEPALKPNDTPARGKRKGRAEPGLIGGNTPATGRFSAAGEQPDEPLERPAEEKLDLAKEAAQKPAPTKRELVEDDAPREQAAPAAEPAAPAPQGVLGGAPGTALDEAEAAPAKDSAAAPRPPVSRGPPSLPKALSERLAEQRARRPAAPARDKARADTDRERRTEQLQLTLATAERELEQGRAAEALELYAGVFRQDPRGALAGSVPVVGQMRALFALARHQEVLSFLPVLERRPQDDVKVEGLWTAARSAEALGRLDVAEGLYRRLVAVKDRKQAAAAALARVRADKQRVRAPAATSVPAETSKP